MVTPGSRSSSLDSVVVHPQSVFIFTCSGASPVLAMLSSNLLSLFCAISPKLNVLGEVTTVAFAGSSVTISSASSNVLMFFCLRLLFIMLDLRLVSRKCTGFTIIELMIVVVILGLVLFVGGVLGNKLLKDGLSDELTVRANILNLGVSQYQTVNPSVNLVGALNLTNGDDRYGTLGPSFVYSEYVFRKVRPYLQDCQYTSFYDYTYLMNNPASTICLSKSYARDHTKPKFIVVPVGSIVGDCL